MKKFEAFIQKTCRILELALAVLVMIGIVLALLSFFKDGVIFIELLGNIDMFQQYRNRIFADAVSSKLGQRDRSHYFFGGKTYDCGKHDAL